MPPQIDITKPFEFADRNSPRFNTRTYRQKIISKELHKAWKQKTGYNISFDEFKRIWRLITIEIHLGITEEPNGILLPYGIGELYVGWVKTRLRCIDYKISREVGKVIYYENYHSYGKVGKLIYHPCPKYCMYTCRMWNFTPITPLIAKVTKSLKEKPEIYKNSRQKKYYNGSSTNRPVDIPSKESTKDG